MYEDERPRYRQRSRSRSPRGRRTGDNDEQDYYRSRKDDPSPGYRRPQPYDSSLQYDDEQPTIGRELGRSRSQSQHRQQHGPGRPSATIIMEGLPSDATEDDVLDGFASVSPDMRVFNADTIKAVRLRGTNRRGHRIGFVEFFTVNDAAHFLEFHYPSLEFPLAHSRGMNSEVVAVSINYSRGREDDTQAERGREDRGRDEADWKCPECSFMNYGSRNRCHRCRGAKSDGYEAASYGPRLTGETDECPQQFPSQYLIIRGLDPTINEELFAEGVKKLYVEAKPEPKKETQNKLKSTAPTANTARLGARPDSLRRVFLIRDKYSDEGMRYGFAEFATLEDAQGAITKFKASPNITISSKPVTVAFIHTGVFVPHTGRVTEENSRHIFNPIYNRDIFLKYWDNRVYPSILRVTDDAETTKRQADSENSPEKQGNTNSDELTTMTDASGKKIKKFKLGQASVKTAPVMAPQMQMWAKKRAELVGKARTETDDSLESSPAPSERLAVPSKRSRPKDTYTSFADTKNLSCMLCLRKFASMVALRDHESLNKEHQGNRHDEEKRNRAIEQLKTAGTRPRQITIRVANTSHIPSDRIYTSYADRDNIHCLVCQRKFSKLGLLSLHERESEMHRLNLADQTNIERAVSQLARVGKTPRKMVPATNKGTQYRDRAKERRQAFKQPNAPRRKAPVDMGPGEPEPEEKAAVQSKGAALLGKMGWTAGEGLGADNTGRTDVIATDVYAAGVGLGAEGAKLGDAAEEAARKTKDNYTDFVEVTRNKARERYEKLG